jgi:hypothetical protein
MEDTSFLFPFIHKRKKSDGKKLTRAKRKKRETADIFMFARKKMEDKEK